MCFILLVLSSGRAGRICAKHNRHLGPLRALPPAPRPPPALSNPPPCGEGRVCRCRGELAGEERKPLPPPNVAWGRCSRVFLSQGSGRLSHPCHPLVRGHSWSRQPAHCALVSQNSAACCCVTSALCTRGGCISVLGAVKREGILGRCRSRTNPAGSRRSLRPSPSSSLSPEDPAS